MLLLRAQLCQWNIFTGANLNGTLDLVVITKAYHNLFNAPSEDTEAYKAIVQVYVPYLKGFVHGLRPCLSAEVKPNNDYHVYLAICKAGNLPTTLATGILPR